MNNVHIQAIDDPLGFLLDGKNSVNTNRFMSLDDPTPVNQDIETVINPCPFHPINSLEDDQVEATHICVDEKLALCDECAIMHAKKKNHQILNMQTCVNETRVVLNSVESQIKEIIKDKQSAVSRGKNVVKMLDTKKQRFIEKQQLKLEKVMRLLKEQMQLSIKEYEEQIFNKYGKVIEQMKMTEQNAAEKEDYLKDVQHLRKVFGQRSINNIVTKICTAGDLIIKFKRYAAAQNEDPELEEVENQIANENKKIDDIALTNRNKESNNNNMNTISTKKSNKQEAQINLEQIQRKKIRIVRWKTKKIGEYELDTKIWTLTDAQVSQIFLPFSRTVYLPNQDLVNLGGLDDSIPSKPFFTQNCEMLSQVAFNEDENLYVPTSLHQMRIGRGCFSACYHDEMIYVFGGVNLEEGVIANCEKYDTEKDIWYVIRNLNIPRKNSSVCPLTADTLYLFGGTNHLGVMTDTIEQYLISANMWILLEIKMPNPISFLTTFKVSPFQIILLGGLIESDSEDRVSYPSNQVLQFDIRYPEIFRSENLFKDFVSIYPAFYDEDGQLLLINEDGRSDSPEVLKYDINRYLVRPSNYLTLNDDI
ncbi:kelch motif family protein [Stylonychia lemnae]|uniref:Kelch motif family protein n=1 Tax=Stylonychia lemnae TaxID=5949 RepID=A0A077ZQ85_STYLE|nr:kelch motif family protein [Stylonychia lemnae]|eukprot:CDW71550.1 kelch motif family protein [Stylonychia lemnae]